jgi:nucleoside recognition membrane protein YjiH
MHGSFSSSTRGALQAAALVCQARPWWQRAFLVVFACINLAAIGTFFAVFVGVVMAPPNPRSGIFLLVVGGFAFAVLVMGQFVYWSWLALRRFKERRP